ncbi:MAG: hypothetical protein KJO91_06720 [Gammaproteobacteria bacterium]|nr:hypothetical protein [Gammaproteobacteria bacterium]
MSSQEIIDHVFWLIDSHNIGEVQSDYDQVVYATGLDSMTIKEEDIHRIMEISTGLGQGRGKFRTAIIAIEPYNIKLAHMYKTLASDAELEVELCENFEAAFAWLDCENPAPTKYV